MQLIKSPLWEHQLEAVNRLSDEDRILCAWEMGTGKTMFSIERDLRMRLAQGLKKTLVVAPLATHKGWADTFAREAPNLSVARINPKKRQGLLAQDADVTIVHYEVLRLMPELINLFEHGIFDECHRLKSRSTAQTKAAKKLKIPVLTDMSGSPITNKPQDIWSILNHLYPKNYSSYWRFFHQMTDSERPMVTENGQVKQAQYWVTHGPSNLWKTNGLDEIDPFYDRRLARDCPDLDYARRPVLETTLNVDLDPKMLKQYKEMKKEMITWIDSQDDLEAPLIAPIVLTKYQKLQQLSTATLKMVGDKTTMVAPAPKIQAVLDLAQDTGKPLVVFDPWTSPLKLLKEMGERPRTNIKVGLYTGQQNAKQRERVLQEFKDGSIQILAMTHGAGGEGIDGLQHVCNTVVFLDRDWSPFVNDQAIARINRAGQEQTVNVIDVLANGTLNAKRNEDINYKKTAILETLGDI